MEGSRVLLEYLSRAVIFVNKRSSRVENSKTPYCVGLMAHPIQHWQSTWTSSTENIYPLTHILHTSDSECFLETIRSPFPFLLGKGILSLLLGISFHSDVGLTLLSKGWWQKGKEKLLPFFFYHLLLSTQIIFLIFYTKAGFKREEEKRRLDHCSS